MILLRAHHLLCIQGFQGYGYSESFIENLDKISKLLKDERVIVNLCDYPDDVCKECPNLNDGVCIDSNHNQLIVDMDNKVLEKIGFISVSESNVLFENINSILKKEDIMGICGDCKWIDKCLFYQKSVESMR